MNEVILQADNVRVRIGAAEIVRDATLALRRGEFAVLLGPNGAGKTTLMRALAGLLPAEGTITIEGQSLAALPAQARARRIAYLPQGNVFHWPMPVEDIVRLGRYPHDDQFSAPAADDLAAVKRAMAATAIEALAGRSVTSLSGGERARVALARALATEATILLADEPTVSLDARHQLIVMQLLRGAAHAGGAVLAVVHDLALAARFADTVLVMADGRLVAQAPPAEALSDAIMADVFRISAYRASYHEEAVILPWAGV
jgi:iron complex transport system ATP-binding protein